MPDGRTSRFIRRKAVSSRQERIRAVLAHCIEAQGIADEMGYAFLSYLLGIVILEASSEPGSKDEEQAAPTGASDSRT